jgi:acetyl-CoA carboxylase biotin carboxyl carrier protein
MAQLKKVAMNLTEDEVQRIIKIIDALDYGEIHLEYGDLKITLQRGGPRDAVLSESPGGADPNVRRAPDQMRTVAEQDPQPEKRRLNEIDAGWHVVRSPVSGIFFSAPSPGAAPFIQVGSTVEPDDLVCLVEVMKLFTSVSAGIRGRIMEVRAANGELVGRGDILVCIAPFF